MVTSQRNVISASPRRGDMRERDVRSILDKEVIAWFPEEDDTLVLHEFGVCQGNARVDVAVINGHIHGFEIKSEKDTLERLPSQIEAYDKVLETMTIVTGQKHLERVKEIVPRWWGIMLVVETKGGLRLKVIRKRRNNPHIDPYCLAQLLWHDEALAILEENSLASGVRNKPRRFLWDALARNIPIVKLSEIVRETLKQRETLKKRNTREVALQQK